MILSRLIEQVHGAKKPSRRLDAWIETEIRRFEAYKAGLNDETRAMWAPIGSTGEVSDTSTRYHAPLYTFDLSVSVQTIYRVLPGWGWRAASCCVSDDAWVFPDFNDPVHGEKLKRLIPTTLHRDPIEALGTDVDRQPSGHPALALMESILIGMSWQTEFEFPQFSKPCTRA